jgi:predicted DNA-binding protein (MmcQ/YjbR family)
MTGTRTKPNKTVARDEAQLAKHAFGYPEVHDEWPWGDRAFKVHKKKVFLFMVADGDGLHLSVKLPHSSEAALLLPFATPTGYGLGKSGWVSANFTSRDKVPLDLLRAWIDESYRAVAPAKLVKQLDGGTAAPAPKPKRKAPRKAARKATPKRKPK